MIKQWVLFYYMLHIVLKMFVEKCHTFGLTFEIRGSNNSINTFFHKSTYLYLPLIRRFCLFVCFVWAFSSHSRSFLANEDIVSGEGLRRHILSPARICYGILGANCRPKICIVAGDNIYTYYYNSYLIRSAGSSQVDRHGSPDQTRPGAKYLLYGHDKQAIVLY